ncbi:MAG: DUF4230 domain-containing protein [Bacteroides sp.]|nr:DUF4230 domain-containing protein [Prevotella sp.]MCM1408187.1 DUF4230 domain-containing protein [Treponema brennaborense]MCM1469511.1 DUF4230 domain-containing protein [Bacteroides sp.]
MRGKKTDAQEKRTPLRLKRLIFNAACRIILFALCAGAIWYGFKQFAKIRYESVSALVSAELAKCAELTVVKNNYSDIVTLKKSAVFGIAKSYSIIRYSGVVRAGIADLSAAAFSVSQDCKSVHVVLPPVAVLGNDITHFEVFDEMNNIFMPIAAREIFAEIDKSRLNALDSIASSGLLLEAQNHCRLLVSHLLAAMKFEDISVDFMKSAE